VIIFFNSVLKVTFNNKKYESYAYYDFEDVVLSHLNIKFKPLIIDSVSCKNMTWLYLFNPLRH